MAEKQGFEPWEGINPQRFSRPPLSAAQPPLHKMSIIADSAKNATFFFNFLCYLFSFCLYLIKLICFKIEYFKTMKTVLFKIIVPSVE